MTLQAGATQEGVALAHVLEDLLVLLAPLLPASCLLDCPLVGGCLVLVGLPAVLGETPGVVHLELALGAEQHPALQALQLARLVAPVALLGLSPVVVLYYLEQLGAGRAEFLIGALAAYAGTIFLVLVPAGLADEELAAASQQGRLGLDAADLALQHLNL